MTRSGHSIAIEESGSSPAPTREDRNHRDELLGRVHDSRVQTQTGVASTFVRERAPPPVSTVAQRCHCHEPIARLLLVAMTCPLEWNRLGSHHRKEIHPWQK